MSEIFSVLLTTPDGLPYVVPGTEIISLKKVIRQQINIDAQYYTQINTGIEKNKLIIPFVRSEGAKSEVSSALAVKDGYYHIELYAGLTNVNCTVHIYLFSYTDNQPLPEFGAAFWDETGKCILTSETKILKTEQSFNPSVNSGNQTVGKKLAIMSNLSGSGYAQIWIQDYGWTEYVSSGVSCSTQGSSSVISFPKFKHISRPPGEILEYHFDYFKLNFPCIDASVYD